MTTILYNVNIPRFFVSHRLPLALAARDAGYDVHVTTSDADKENVAKIIETGLPYHPLPLSQHGTSPVTEARTLLAMIQLYRQLKPDIVHHVSIKPVLYGGVAAQLGGVKAVVGAMSGLGYVFIDDSLKARIIRQIAKVMFRVVFAPTNTRMIFQNPDDQQAFVDKGLLAANKTVLIRGSGVDLAQFVAQTEPDGQPMVLFAGRLMWRKGVGKFAEVARALQHKARFVIVGFAEATSPDTVSVEQLQQWVDEGILEWWGKRDDMPDIFAQSHIVVLPSTYGEGVPKVLIEAAACARPLVTTDTAGCREIARHEVNGLLVPPHDTNALIAAVERLIDNPELRRKFGQAGREIAANEFALQQVIDATFQVYERLLHG